MGRAHKLTALGVERQKIAGLYGDGAGLWLKVTTGGSKSWILRYTFGGRERWAGLGPYPDVSLEEAREAATDLRKKVRSGTDPIDEKRERAAAARANSAKAVTFDWCAHEYIKAHRAGWSNPKHAQQWENTLAQYASPKIGKLDVARIDTAHIIMVLTQDDLWTTKTETASRLRGRIECVLAWAATRKFRAGDNPARWKGHLDTLLPAPSKVSKESHHAALPWQRMAEFIAALRKIEGNGARGLEFAILTAARSGEVRGATWSEFDIEAGLWTVPAARMKAGKEHRVPLSARALEILLHMRGDNRRDPDELVFPGMKRSTPLSDMTMTATIRRLHDADTKAGGEGFIDPKLRRVVTAHGFRSSFRDWAAETTAYPHEMCEMALAHTIGDKAEKAYRRGDLFAKRRRMMADWAKHCDTILPDGGVVPIRSNTAA